MELNLQDATLETIANGALGEQWKDALAQIATIFANATSGMECPYEAPKNVVTAKVSVGIEIAYSMESHTITVSAGLDVKPPKRRKSVGGIYHKDHTWSVAHEPEQATMFGAQVKSIRVATAKEA